MLPSSQAVPTRELADVEPGATCFESNSSQRPDSKYMLHAALNCHRDGRIQQAELLYRDCLAKGQQSFQIYSNLGAICLYDDRVAEAISLFQQAIALQPQNAESYCNLGAAYKQQGQLKKAITCQQKALALRPNYPGALNNLGNVYLEQKQLDEAISTYERALTFSPNNPEVLQNLGNALSQQCHYDRALEFTRRALALRPNYMEALETLGNIYQGQGRLQEAVASYDRALAIAPQRSLTHKNLSMVLLLLGDFERGWQEYEWRFQSNPRLLPTIEMERWDGDDSFREELVLVCEQGLGDALQFVRYAPVLKSQFAKVSIRAPKKLQELFQYSELADEILPRTQLEAREDARWVPLMSVPPLLGATVDTPIADRPYLSAPPERIAAWAQTLKGDRQELIVGINWQGNPSHETMTSTGRSLPLETFAPLAKLPGIQLLSLQKGTGSEQMEHCSFRSAFIEAQPEVDRAWDFVDTAAIVMNCDLVITSDTSVAHLAGGLGVPTWILLKKMPEWRWGLEGDTTAWYPQSRLFRQWVDGDWAEVMDRVQLELANLAGDRSPINRVSTDENADAAAEDILTNPQCDKQDTRIASVQTSESVNVTVPISIGELVDKIVILEIKVERLKSDRQKAHAQHELDRLREVLSLSGLEIEEKEIAALKSINGLLWDIEDRIRGLEKQKDFGEEFIYQARSVYLQNDRRAALKRKINDCYCSEFIEEKSYETY